MLKIYHEALCLNLNLLYVNKSQSYSFQCYKNRQNLDNCILKLIQDRIIYIKIQLKKLKLADHNDQIKESLNIILKIVINLLSNFKDSAQNMSQQINPPDSIKRKSNSQFQLQQLDSIQKPLNSQFNSRQEIQMNQLPQAHQPQQTFQIQFNIQQNNEQEQTQLIELNLSLNTQNLFSIHINFQIIYQPNHAQEIISDQNPFINTIITDLQAVDYSSPDQMLRFSKKHPSICQIANSCSKLHFNNKEYLGILKTIFNFKMSLQILVRQRQRRRLPLPFPFNHLDNFCSYFKSISPDKTLTKIKNIFRYYERLLYSILLFSYPKSYKNNIKLEKYWNQRITEKPQFSPEELTLLTQQILAKSKTISSKSHVKTLIQFFESKVKSFQLIYSAKENKFSANEFLQKYGHLKSTLIICKTVTGKIFGGYTPLSHGFTGNEMQTIWDKKVKQESVFDDTMNSFIFELGTGQRRYLKKGRPAIKRAQSLKKITFGEKQFVINDQKQLYSRGIIIFRSIFSLEYDCFSYFPIDKSITPREILRFKIADWQAYHVEI